MSAKVKTEPKELGDCDVGTIARTPAGFLLVTGCINGRPLVRLWCPSEMRHVSEPFPVEPGLAVLSTERKPMPTAGAGHEVDPVRGR